LLEERFDGRELATLSELLERVAGPVDCELGE
jgi:hypothetical protein